MRKLQDQNGLGQGLHNEAKENNQDSCSSVKNLASKFENASLNGPQKPVDTDEVDCKIPNQQLQPSNRETDRSGAPSLPQVTREEVSLSKELFTREYTQCNSLQFPSHSGHESRLSSSYRTRIENADGVNTNAKDSISDSAKDESDLNTSTDTTASDGVKKKKSKKSVTFCDQVVLVATAEDEEEDAYIPNPILERVLKSALTSSSSLSDTDTSSSCGESVCSRMSSQSQGKIGVSTPQASPHYHSSTNQQSQQVQHQFSQPHPSQGYPNPTGHLPTHHAQPVPASLHPQPTTSQPYSSQSYTNQTHPIPNQTHSPSISSHQNHTLPTHNHQAYTQQYSQPPQTNSSVRLPPPYQPPPSVNKIVVSNGQPNQVVHAQGQPHPLANGLHPSQMPHLIPGQHSARPAPQQQQQWQQPPHHYQQQSQAQRQTPIPYPGMVRQNSSLGFQHHTETERVYPPYQRVPHPNHSQGQQQSHPQIVQQKMHPQVHQPLTALVSNQPSSYNGYSSNASFSMQQHTHPHQQQQQHGPGYGSVGRGGVKGTPTHFCGPLDPSAIYSTVNKVNKKTTAASSTNGALQPCNLCRKKCVNPPSTYCNDCEFYMSRFKPKV
ncbi:hypothetical protein SK128_019597 [Halocaridina rubra]|uniref:Uncharacterized protein n=1 Tax=Halocaridina rubra TaxID=373956 RepID=A0AAN8XIY8_HALRR